jgi:tetratricopeptide (TPR) repeat protein
MHTLTLTFTSPDTAPIRLRAESSLGGEWHGTFQPPFDATTLSAITRALEPNFDPQGMQEAETVATLEAASLPLGDALPATVGERLDAALRASKLIANAINELSGAALARNEPLHLALEFGDGCNAVAALPWELLRHEGRFLVADNTLALTRSPVGAVPYTETLGELPLRILLVLSEPLSASPIAPERQARGLAHGLRDLAAEGAVVVDELRPPTYDALVEAVRGGDYHVLHFYGHGVYHEGAGYLLFEDPYGGPDQVRADDVGAVLNRSDVRLVVMGACQSAMVGPSTGSGQVADQWSSTAAALLRAGVPLVVGMQVSMRVVAAQAFTRQFYLSLAAGKDVAQALGDARLPLRRDAYGKSWFIPALYCRAQGEPHLFDPDKRVSRRAQDEIAQLRALQAEVERREEESSRLRVAQFAVEVAQLRGTQERLRQAQAEWRRDERGAYRPVVSPVYGAPPRAPHFVGRVEAMQRVARGLEGEWPVVIWGMGGIGKTALAIEAVHRQDWRFPGGVLWLDCQNARPFGNLLNHIGAFCGHPEVQDMEPEQRQARVRALLAGLERPLLVWDNAEAVWGERAVREFVANLPRNCGCLLTTRRDPEQSGWPTVELDELAGAEMTSLFLALGAAAGVKVAAQDWPLLPRVLEWLQGHPLALTLAVPLVKKRGLARLWADLQRQPLKGVEAALRASLKRLNALQKRAFTCLSVFTIPFQYPAVEALLPEPGEGVDEAVDTLAQHALLAFDGRSYFCHALVRQFAYGELQRTRDDWREMHRRAAEYLQAKGKDEALTPVERLEMVDQWERTEEWETFAGQALGLVGTLDRHGYWPEIEERLQRAREAVRAHLEDTGLETQLLNDSGILASKGGEWERAIALWEECERRYAEKSNEEGQAQAWVNLGSVYADKGEWDRAIEMYQRSLETYEHMEDVRGMAQTWGNLGLVYANKGEWDRAIEMYQKDLEISERMEDVRGMAQTWGNLGSVYYRKGEWDRAIEMYQRSLETFERVEDEHGMAKTFNNLGSVYADKGEWDRAIEMYQRSQEIDERVGDIQGAAKTINNLGIVYKGKGEWDRAIEMYQCSLEIDERVGDVHRMAQTWVNLGLVYANKGEWDRATEMYQRSLETFERMRDEHRMAQAWVNLGLVYANKGEWERAIEMYQRSLETFGRMEDVHGMAQTWGNLALFYEAQGDKERAAEYLVQAYLVFAQLGASPEAHQAASDLVRILGSVKAASAYLADFQQRQN